MADAKRALRGTLALSAEQRRYLAEHIVPAWCAPEQKERFAAALQRK